MGQPLDEMLKIGTEVRVPVATAQLAQFHFTDATRVSRARCSWS